MGNNLSPKNDLPVRRQLSLWDVITLLSGAITLGNAWTAARVLDAGLAASTVAIGIGLIVGVGCVWTIRRLGSLKITGAHGEVDAAEHKTWLLYIGAAIWLVVSGFLGYQAAKCGLQLLG